MSRSLLKISTVGLMLLLLLLTAHAQKTTGAITGAVTDPSGAVVPDAAVKATEQHTGAARESTTNSGGVFTVPELSPGVYNVTVTKQGFRQASQKNVEVHVAGTTALNVQLQVGAPSEVVEVESSPVLVETQTGAVSNIMLGTQVRELPLNARNFVQLTTLMPGASVAENFDPKNKGLLAGVDISFSGAPANTNQWLVDGANNNDIGSQRTILVYPSIDGIEEFKILRNSYGPEYSGGSGSQVNIVTRGGGNKFHGSVYYFGRNDALNAKNYFIAEEPCADELSCRRQLLRRHDWGYTIGGPIKTDRAFFFFSQEWNRERRGRVRFRWVPTEQQRTGDFRDLGGGQDPLVNASACPGRVPIDPLTGQRFTFGGQLDVIDPARISPGGQAYLSLLSLPNVSDPCAEFNWRSQVRIPVNWREESVRGDLNITEKVKLMIRFTNDAWENPQFADAEGGLWGEQDFPTISDAWTQPGKMAVARLTTVLNNTTVNDFQFSWSGNRITIGRGGDDPTLNETITAQIAYVFPVNNKFQGSQLAAPVCWCGGNPSGFLGVTSPFFNRQDSYVWKDDFSKVLGRHTIKAGFLYARHAKDEVPQGNESGGLWGGSGVGLAADFAANGWGNGTGNWYSDILLRDMTFGYGEASRDAVTQIRWRDLEFYAGDTWKVHPHLNLEYGVRWSLIRAPYLDDNTYAGFRPELYDPALGSDSCNGIVIAAGGPNTCSDLGSVSGTFADNRTLVPNNNHLFAPRLGFAWDVFGNSKFVVRGGAGQFFARDPVGIQIRVRSQNAPFAAVFGGNRALDGPLVQGVNLFGAVGARPVEGLENNSNWANTWQWNLTTETALWKDAKFELAWVGLRGIHLHSSHDANQIAPEDRLTFIQRTVAGQSTTDLFPFGPLTTGGIVIWDHRGDSVYHSLQAMLSSRLARNSLFQTSYTWSHNIGNTTGAYVNVDTGRADTYNSRVSRGSNNFDRRHVFNASLVYNLPTLSDRGSFLRNVAGSWQLGSILSLASGPAVTVSGSVAGVPPAANPWGVGNSGGVAGSTGNATAALPMRVFSEPCHVEGNRRQWLNQSAFTWDGFPLGGYPNAGPGQCAGPGIANFDLAFDKNWELPFLKGSYFGEKARLQFRLEIFNAFNHPMFRFGNIAAPPGVNLGFDVAGAAALTPTSTVVDCSACTLTSGSFGQLRLSSNIGNREIQYALKLIW